MKEEIVRIIGDGICWFVCLKKKDSSLGQVAQ